MIYMTDDIVFGIDFGTTSSCVSYFTKKDNKFTVIKNKNGKDITPSIVYFEPDSDNILFGEDALEIYSLKSTKKQNFFTNIKRLIGKELSSLDRNTDRFFDKNVIKINNFVICRKGELVEISYVDIIKSYIYHLKEMIFLTIQHKIQKIDVVITVPAYYNELQRNILKKCFIDCNLNVIRILNEPIAATLYSTYINRNLDKEYNALVFDCGGGTTDISIVHIDKYENVYDVLEVVGDNYLGGMDITQCLVDFFSSKTNVSDDKLRVYCEKLKCDLTYKVNALLYLESCDYRFTMSRNMFNSICEPFYKKIDLLLSKLDNDFFDISEIIFIGNSSVIPFLQYKVLKKFVKAQKRDDINKETTVSLGAALMGVLLKGLFKDVNDFKDTLLIDITHLSLGVETENGIMCPIISKNTIIPTSKTVEFTNSEKNDKIDINIYQGENRYVKDNFLIEKCILKNVPKSEKNSLVIKVTFSINSDGILSVVAKLKNDESINVIIEKNISSDIKINETRMKQIDKIENEKIDKIINDQY